MAHVVFAGGGTGGHIYPALAIAKELRGLEPSIQCSWLVSRRPIDAEILKREGQAWQTLHAQPFGVRPKALARFVGAWGPSVRAARATIREAQSESKDRLVYLVAMGGFVAPPAVQAARAERIGAMLVNLDAVPGRANRWIAKRVGGRFSTTSGGAVPSAWSSIPPIVRRNVISSESPEESRRAFGLDGDRRTLLVTGGSQGARTVNQLMVQICRKTPELLSGWQVIHQYGEEEAGLAQAYQEAGIRALVVPFIATMGGAWNAADLALCRSGAGAVAESWATRTPCLFLPYPFHRDGHQRRNAAPLAEQGGAMVLEDLIDPALNFARHTDLLHEVLTDEKRVGAMRRALEVLGPADGAQRVAREVLERLTHA